MSLLRRSGGLLGRGVLLAGLFLLPYCQFPWWQYFHTTLLWVLLWLARFGRSALERLGLAFPPVDRLLVPLAVGLLVPAALLVQQWVTPGLERVWLEFPEDVDPLFQALNEEILLGWLLLRWVSRGIRDPRLLCWVVALAFALLHFAFYRWGSFVYEQALSPAALLGLLLVGAARNALIVWRGHVGYAWALHGGWNVGFFGSQWRRGDTGEPLGEPELFDQFLGSPLVITAAGVLALLGTALVWLGAHSAFRG